jgi:hypothetical protein
MSTQRRHVAVALVVTLVGFAPIVHAQNVGGAVSGIVSDAAGARVAVAQLTLVHAETSIVRRATSDDEGRYQLASLGPGGYQLEVRVQGFAPHTEELEVTAGQTLVLDIQLQIAQGREDIQVAASTLQRESAELGGFVSREAILGLPVNGRSYEQLTLLEPGVVSTTSRETGVLYQHGLKININGATSRSNAFLLDGTSVADLYNNGLGSVAGTFLGLEAVRELQVLTNAFQASYGGVSGGVVSIITKSGSSELHGSAFGTFRDGRIDAKNYFDTEKPKFWRRQAGFSLGGPAVRDRAVFFFTGEWLRESMGLTQIATVPSLTARNGELADPQNAGSIVAVNPVVRPFLDLFPLPNGVDFGDGLAEYRFAATRPTRENFGQGRVDVDLGSRNSLFTRLTLDDARRVEPGNYPGADVDWDSTSGFLTIEDAHVLSDRIVNTARLSYSVTDLSQTDTTGRGLTEMLSVVPSRGMPHLVIGGMPAFGSLVSPHTRGRQRLLAVANDLAMSRGSHLLKIGALVERLDALIDFRIFWTGRYSFPSVLQFLQGRPSVLSLALPGSESLRELSSTQLGMYVQDDVKLSPTLTISAGLRWEFATAPREAEGRLVALPDPLHDTTPVIGTLLETERTNLAPRVGVVWMPARDAHMVIRAGGGIFYDINTLPFVAQTVGNNPPFYNQVTITNPGFPKPNLPASTVLSLGVPQYDWRTPRLVHYNAAFERELSGRTTVTIAYAGSRGTHVVRSGDLNAPIPQVQPDGTPVFALRSARRNPAFGAITIRTTDGHSWYDALQMKLARRLHDGLQFQVAYTLARTTDETQGTVPTESNGSVTQWMDPDHARTDRGPADFERRHNLTAHVIWNTPRLTHGAAPLRRVLSDWTISGVVALRSGNPFTVGIQNDYSRTLARVSVDRPNVRPEVDPDRIVLGGPDRYFDASAFELQAPGTFGNVRRNSFTGPGLATVDLALAKTLFSGWGGRAGGLQVRLDVFNLLNRANFGMPQRIVFAGVQQNEAPIGSAGRITSTTTGPRELQLSLRASW